MASQPTKSTAATKNNGCSAVSSLTFDQLLNECRDAGVLAADKVEQLRRLVLPNTSTNPTTSRSEGGSGDPSTKRQADAEPDEAPSAKRPKSSIEDDLLCPITKDLPFNPVTAEDGVVYEREAIEEYFNSHPEWRWFVRSPVTNQTMGKRLLASPLIKSHIETLIEHGVLRGVSAEVWKAKSEGKKQLDDLVRKANQGHTNSMLRVARRFKHGVAGCELDLKKAYEWYEKAHRNGSLRGMAHLGEFLVKGIGVARDERKGAMYISIAAGRGSDCAAYELGTALADGRYGFPVDKKDAIHWLQECLSGNCRAKHLGQSAKQRAQELLDELQRDYQV